MRYEAVWYTHEGVRKGVIQAFNSLEYIKTQNAVGSLVINLPRGLMQYDQFAVGDIFEVWREKNGTLELQNETAYFLQNWEFWADGDGAEYIRLTAFDANWLLGTRLAWAKGGSQPGGTRTGYPDDIMKGIISDQFITNSARPERNIPITCAPNLGAGGASITKKYKHRVVLDAIVELAEQANENGVWLGFDVVRTAPATFEFRTYTGQRGQNHGRASGDPRLVGKQYGNLSQATFGTYHMDEYNSILIIGSTDPDVGVARENSARANASKWNRREYFVSSAAEATTDEMNSEADAALEEYKPRQVLTGTLHDTPGMQYGIHYWFGDILSVEAFGHFVDCHVKAVRVRVDQDGGEQLDIKLEGEL